MGAEVIGNRIFFNCHSSLTNSPTATVILNQSTRCFGMTKKEYAGLFIHAFSWEETATALTNREKENILIAIHEKGDSRFAHMVHL